MIKNKSTLCVLILLTFLITAISYRSYFKYGWYDMDDYYTFEFAPAGISVSQACKATTDFLYSSQHRYQPVRLCLFVVMTRFFDEESSVYYNFALHLVNILLLFLLLRKFRIGSIFSLISVLLFAVFGRSRYMDSSSVMIGGSGLNLLFILTTFLFLIKSLQTHVSEFVRRYFFLALSLLAYSSLVFSYEVAFPLFAPLVVVFYLFNRAGKGLLGPLRTKKSFYLLLYLVPLLIYLIFFRLLVKSSYEGTKIVWSLNILTRLKSYVLYTLLPPFQTHGLKTVEVIILIIYFTAIILALKSNKSNISHFDKKKTGLEFLLFCAVFYPSTIVLFILNDWLTPANVMVHHTYLMTAAGAMLLTSFIYNLQWILPVSFRKKYFAILIIFIFPIILINGERHTVRNYKNDSTRVNAIRTMKKGIQAAIADTEKIDVILLKNFFFPYYNISSMDGAFLKWFGFKKPILSGREIISVRGDDIIFRGPLQLYVAPEKLKVKNDRIRIFFVRKKDGAILPYHDEIDFKKGRNLYQTEQVKKKCPKVECNDKNRLEAILSNIKRNGYLNIWFKSSQDTKNFLKNVTLLEVNDERVPAEKMTVERDRLSIDVSESTKKINYFFLKILSSDNKFKQSVRLMALTMLLP